MVLCEICSTGWHLKCLPQAPTCPQITRAGAKDTEYYCRYCRNVGRYDDKVQANLSTAELKQQLTRYAPGKWNSSHLRKLSNKMDGSIKQPFEYLETTENEWDVLFQSIVVPEGHYVWDPFAGNKYGLENAVPAGTRVYTNDINPAAVADTHFDATRLKYYETFTLNNGRNGLLVTSMPFSLSDVIIPMLVSELHGIAICVHVGPNFISDAPLPRHVYMQKLFQQERVHIIHGTNRNASGHRGQWVLIVPKGSDVKNYLSALTRSTLGKVTYSTI
jgi:hypothetical protein